MTTTTTSATSTQNVITLRGSTAIVTEFFGYSINSILYQRGIYPPETFSRVAKYGLSMLVTSDDKLKGYIANVLSQLSEWIMRRSVQKLVLVISGADSNEVMERWVFHIEPDPATRVEAEPTSDKSEKDVMAEIQAIIRQITASVTFLPLLDEPCTFDLLVYTGEDVDIPQSWEESDPRYINNSAEVRLRSFTTKIHKVDTVVTYKNPDVESS